MYNVWAGQCNPRRGHRKEKTDKNKETMDDDIKGWTEEAPEDVGIYIHQGM